MNDKQTLPVIRLFSILSYAKVQRPKETIGQLIFNALQDGQPLHVIGDHDLVEAITTYLTQRDKKAG